MACETSNYRILPQAVYFGSNTYQEQCVTCVADVAGSLGAKYFLLYAPDGTKHAYWFDIDNGSVAPTVAGATLHEVDISSGATASAVAAALEPVIEATTGFDSTVSGETVDITCTSYGYAYPAHDGYSTNGCGFSFKLVTAGSAEEDLGATDGDISLSIEESMTDVTTHQNGTIPVDSIITGRTISVSLTLKEVTKAKIARIIQLSGGDTLLPNGSSATALSGFGTGGLFRSVYVFANRLRLHPVAKSSADKSEDIVMPKAKIKFGEMTFSGENILMLPLEIVAYPDADAQFDVLDMMTYGDYSQSL